MKKYDLYLKGYVGAEDFDINYVEYYLEKNPDREVTVLINSLGGRTDTGISVAAAFARHGKVSVHFSGMSASAATIAAMGARHISIDRGAGYMIHKAGQELLIYDRFNSDDMTKFIAELENRKKSLDAIDYSVASMYAARCKKTPAELLELMSEDTWLTAEEALEWGLVDEIKELIEGEQPDPMPKSLASDLESAGLPVPDKKKFPGVAKTSLIDEIRTQCDRLAAFVSKLTKSDKQMAKIKFPKICSTLGVASLELEQNASVVLSATQLARIESMIVDSEEESTEESEETSESAVESKKCETSEEEKEKKEKKPGEEDPEEEDPETENPEEEQSEEEESEEENPEESSAEQAPITVSVVETSRGSSSSSKSWEQRYAESVRSANELMDLLG